MKIEPDDAAQDQAAELAFVETAVALVSFVPRPNPADGPHQKRARAARRIEHVPRAAARVIEIRERRAQGIANLETTLCLYFREKNR